MRKCLIPFILILGLVAGCENRTPLPSVLEGRIQITSGSDPAVLSFDDLVNRLARTDAVFVGEIHDDSLTHWVELELLQRIHQKQDKLAVALEMFERDVQPSLNAYLGNEISEGQFMAESRPWNNYPTAYRPLVEFARENNLPVLAMNIPRRYARILGMMGEEGLKNNLKEDEKKWVASELKALDDEYKRRFMDQMGGGGRPAAMSRIDPENLYKAQCIKDDTMAESISEFLKNNPDYKVISYQGDFHSAYRLGIVKKLELLNPDVKTAVVSVIPVEDLNQIDHEAHKNQGDYLVFVERVAQKAY